MRYWDYDQDGEMHYYWEDEYYESGGDLLIIAAIALYVISWYKTIADLREMNRNNPYAED